MAVTGGGRGPDGGGHGRIRRGGAPLLRLHDRQLRRAGHGLGGGSPAGIRHHDAAAAHARVEPVSRREPAAPRRVLPGDSRGVPTDPAARRPYPSRRADPVRGVAVPADLFDAAHRPSRCGDPRAGAAAHQGNRRGGRSPMRGTILYAALGALGIACVRPDKAPPASDTTASRADTAASSPAAAPPPAPAPVPAPAPPATKVATVQGFLAPESVLHDSTQDIYFVSNINGSPTAKDNNGFISRVRPDGAVENLKFIEGGRSGVTLNAPKGLAVSGDTLWVADIDAVRSFNAKTGAPLDSVSHATPAAVFLNDIALTPTG